MITWKVVAAVELRRMLAWVIYDSVQATFLLGEFMPSNHHSQIALRKITSSAR